mmetsp:Transcript_64384/g.153570  ORF Transcript_64384/g.153570 Transcript_64384/m.153570 type:complete len:311 (+) Transcript_64384:258-1190(+)
MRAVSRRDQGHLKVLAFREDIERLGGHPLVRLPPDRQKRTRVYPEAELVADEQLLPASSRIRLVKRLVHLQPPRALPREGQGLHEVVVHLRRVHVHFLQGRAHPFRRRRSVQRLPSEEIRNERDAEDRNRETRGVDHSRRRACVENAEARNLFWVRRSHHHCQVPPQGVSRHENLVGFDDVVDKTLDLPGPERLTVVHRQRLRRSPEPEEIHSVDRRAAGCGDGQQVFAEVRGAPSHAVDEDERRRPGDAVRVRGVRDGVVCPEAVDDMASFPQAALRLSRCSSPRLNAHLPTHGNSLPTRLDPPCGGLL